MSGEKPVYDYKQWYVNPARQIAGCNGDIAITLSNGTIIAVAYAQARPEDTLKNAQLIATAPKLQKENQSLRVQLAEAQGQVGVLRGALKVVEWIPGDLWDYCPSCLHVKKNGHSDFCIIKKALTQTAQAGGARGFTKEEAKAHSKMLGRLGTKVKTVPVEQWEAQ
jgi:hypothetical protein